MKKTPHDLKKITGKSMLALRERTARTQSQFWGEIGVSQSAASRYENGRDIPTPTKVAIAHTYSTELSRHL